MRADLERLIGEGERLRMALMFVAYPEAVEEARSQASAKRTKGASSSRGKKASTLEKLLATAPDFREEYEPWYSEALSVVTQVLPDRAADFRNLYRVDRRKDIDLESYTLADYQIGLTLTRGWNKEEVFNSASAALMKFTQQLNMVKAAQRVIDSRLADIRGVLQADLFDSELDSARELLKSGYLRASGMVAGVVLERHLANVARGHQVKIRSRAPTISHFNNGMKEADVLDVPQWRFVQRLADIRNLCGHPREREPTPEEVQELIDGTGKVTKTIS